jgi:hypothetical protein
MPRLSFAAALGSPVHAKILYRIEDLKTIIQKRGPDIYPAGMLPPADRL